MILGIYSDLHSNLPALESMLSKCADRVDQWICAGDSVGLFPYVNEVIDFQREKGVIAVCGDHEHCLINGTMMSHSFTGNQVLDSQRLSISPENFNYLTTLPTARVVELDGLRLRICHYVQENSALAKYDIDIGKIDELHSDVDVVVFGHSHLLTIVTGQRVLALNPGSAGFPVDVMHCPSMLLLDTKTMYCEIIRFDLDVEKLRNKLIEKNYNKKLIAYLDNNFKWI